MYNIVTCALITEHEYSLLNKDYKPIKRWARNHDYVLNFDYDNSGKCVNAGYFHYNGNVTLEWYNIIKIHKKINGDIVTLREYDAPHTIRYVRCDYGKVYRNTVGYDEHWAEYDQYGNIVHYMDSYDKEFYCKYEYDNNGNILDKKTIYNPRQKLSYKLLMLINKLMGRSNYKFNLCDVFQPTSSSRINFIYD